MAIIVAKSSGMKLITKRHDFPRPVELRDCNLPQMYSEQNPRLTNETEKNFVNNGC